MSKHTRILLLSAALFAYATMAHAKQDHYREGDKCQDGDEETEIKECTKAGVKIPDKGPGNGQKWVCCKKLHEAKFPEEQVSTEAI
jgi:hypothetical protein